MQNFFTGTITNYATLGYEGKIYVIWKTTGELPKRMFDMPVSIMLTLNAIQDELGDFGKK